MFTGCGTALITPFANDLRVDLSRISLARDWVRGSEAEALGDHAIELLDLAMVPVEKGKI